MHKTVLLKEAVDALNIKKDGIYVDGTFGYGGHSRAILSKLGDNGRLYGVDKDANAVKSAQEQFGMDPRFKMYQGSFKEIMNIAVAENIVGKIDGVLLDLGVSSPQIDQAERGFSFMKEGPLDMRMDQSKGMTAAEWIETADEAEIAEVLYVYGEERFSRRIAKLIVQMRESAPVKTTRQLADIIKQAVPKSNKSKKHPATKSFQAIRIFINDELGDLKVVLKNVLNILAIGGRIAVISFHSLEDRLVKHFMNPRVVEPKELQSLPIQPSSVKKIIQSFGLIKPSEAEINENIRARSACLRVGEKVGESI